MSRSDRPPVTRCERDPRVEQAVARIAQAGAVLVAQVAERHQRRHPGGPPARARRRARAAGIGSERPPDPARRLHVAETAAAVLEVGREHLRDRPGLALPLGGAGGEVVDEAVAALRRAAARTLAIMSSSSSSSPASNRMSSSAVSASSSLSARLSASFTVRAEWPSTKPASQSGYHRRRRVFPQRGRTPAAGVQQHHVDVGTRAQLAPRVRAERDQRPTAARAEARASRRSGRGRAALLSARTERRAAEARGRRPARRGRRAA